MAVFNGTTGDDILSDYATSGDTLRGGAGNDTYVANGGSDVFQENRATDSGNDTYVFGRLEGQDTIYEGGHVIPYSPSNYDPVTGAYLYNAASDPLDVIQFEEGIGLSDLVFAQKGANLEIRIAGDNSFNATFITVPSFYLGTYDPITGRYNTVIEQIRLHDGATLEATDMWQQTQATESNDLLHGTAGNDVLLGLGGSDTIFGHEGNDTIDGGAGGATISGDAGDDVYLFGVGSGYHYVMVRSVADAAGFDVLQLAPGLTRSDLDFRGNATSLNLFILNSPYNMFSAPLDASTGRIGIDLIRFADGQTMDLDAIRQAIAGPNGSGNLINGTSAGDVLSGLGGEDTINGLMGDDLLDGGIDNDTLYGNEGQDTLLGGAGDDRLDGGADNDVLVGNDGIDYALGGEGNDWLSGGEGPDILAGQAGQDTLEGGRGDDGLRGGDGDDTFLFGTGLGDDVVSDERYVVNGADTVVFTDGPTPDNIQFSRTSFGADLVLRFAGYAGSLTVRHYFVYASTGSYTLKFADGTTWQESDLTRRFAQWSLGDEANNFLQINARSGDVLRGMGGNDNLNGWRYSEDEAFIGGAGNDKIELAAVTSNIYFGLGDGHDTISSYQPQTGIQRLVFGDGIAPADVLVRRNLVNQSMNLSIQGNAQSVLVLNQFRANGQDNIDEIVFADGTVWLSDELRRRAARGSDGNDTLLADQWESHINALAGDDVVTITDGVGAYVLAGDGNDTVSAAADQTAQSVIFAGAGNDSIHVFNARVEGGEGNDVIYLTRGWVDAGAGDDRIVRNWASNVPVTDLTVVKTRGSGNDALSGSAVLDFSSLSSAEVSIRRTSDVEVLFTIDETGETLAVSVVDVLGVEFADRSMSAFDFQQYLQTPTEGADLIVGFGSVKGLGGNDTLQGVMHYENTLEGGKGQDLLITRNAGDDYFVFGLGDGHDTIQNADAMHTSRGKDVVVLKEDLLASQTHLSVINDKHLLITFQDNASDSVLVQNIYTGVPGGILDPHRDIDEIRFADGTVWSSSQYLALSQGEASAYAQGAYLTSDTPGSDTLVGGVGIDTLAAGVGDDFYVVSETFNADVGGFGKADVVIEQLNAGIDTVSTNISGYVLPANVENLVMTGKGEGMLGKGGPMTVSGNGLDNRITGREFGDLIFGLDGNDTLDGAAGNDTLISGAGQDVLLGGLGDDVYLIDSLDALVVERPNEGVDTIDTSLHAYELLDETLENLTFRSVQAGAPFAEDGVWGKGNANDNVIRNGQLHGVLLGESGNDSLFGSASSLTYDELHGGTGNDWLDGGQGADQLHGGEGDDTYVWGIAHGADVLQDTDGANDVIQLEAGVVAEQLWFQQAGNDLVMRIIGTADQMLIKDWYTSTSNQVERIVLADGRDLQSGQVQALVDAMAGLPPPAQTTLPADSTHAAVAQLIAVSWS